MRYRLRQQLAKFLRQRRGNMTLAQFAKKTGISDSTLQRLEISQQNITLDTLEMILEKMKCDLWDVFGDRE
ncbi:MAG: helix-turn-helix transcriptional regulator [Terrimicrobiaceae bacterium]|nr:helix-turn-helix transcriptional regulator [Terrimicrobiaceae bacterium]